MFWARYDAHERLRDITKQLAYICRYAKGVNLTELLHCGREWLTIFEECISEIVEKENEPND
jgi:hypothetical protein